VKTLWVPLPQETEPGADDQARLFEGTGRPGQLRRTGAFFRDGRPFPDGRTTASFLYERE